MQRAKFLTKVHKPICCPYVYVIIFCTYIQILGNTYVYVHSDKNQHVDIILTLSHLKSKELPRILLGSDYIDVEVEIDCGDQLILK